MVQQKILAMCRRSERKSGYFQFLHHSKHSRSHGYPLVGFAEWIGSLFNPEKIKKQLFLLLNIVSELFVMFVNRFLRMLTNAVKTICDFVKLC